MGFMYVDLLFVYIEKNLRSPNNIYLGPIFVFFGPDDCVYEASDGGPTSVHCSNVGVAVKLTDSAFFRR